MLMNYQVYSLSQVETKLINSLANLNLKDNFIYQTAHYPVAKTMAKKKKSSHYERESKSISRYLNLILFPFISEPSHHAFPLLEYSLPPHFICQTCYQFPCLSLLVMMMIMIMMAKFVECLQRADVLCIDFTYIISFII